MIPSAPARFSTITGWPSALLSGSSMPREIVSWGTVGVSATMKRSGRLGHDWAYAVCAITTANGSSAMPACFISMLLRIRARIVMASNRALSEGKHEPHQVGLAIDMHLGIDVLDVGADRFFRNAEALRRFLVRAAPGELASHAGLR